jgi:hypothetical protein
MKVVKETATVAKAQPEIDLNGMKARTLCDQNGVSPAQTRAQALRIDTTQSAR